MSASESPRARQNWYGTKIRPVWNNPELLEGDKRVVRPRSHSDVRLDAIKIDPAAPTALYLQLATKLGEDIRYGKWSPGEALPAERVMCEQLKISRVTLRQALDALAEQGLVSRRPGAGTFVASHIEHALTGLTGFSPARPGSSKLCDRRRARKCCVSDFRLKARWQAWSDCVAQIPG
jgi:hypothetical protein